jgi:UDP-2-acetamido-3-amino-2,3-dideoxy-glucuronate N-acetyltransferase
VLEDDVFCGPSCVFTNVVNPRSHVPRKSEYQRTLVRRGASIGANATILCGVTLGQYSFVGAGAVVRSDVPDFALMVGGMDVSVWRAAAGPGWTRRLRVVRSDLPGKRRFAPPD